MEKKISLSEMQNMDCNWFYLPDLSSFHLEQLKGFTGCWGSQLLGQSPSGYL